MTRKRLLDEISMESIEKMIPCFGPVKKKYLKGETIMAYSSSELKTLAVLRRGRARLEVLNVDGGTFLLEQYEAGDVFGELFSLPLDNFEYMVVAEEDCVVMYLDYNHFITPCENRCDHHTQLISNLFVMTAQKTQELSLHLSLLSQHTTRDKLTAYLKYIRSMEGGKAEFKIPLSQLLHRHREILPHCILQ